MRARRAAAVCVPTSLKASIVGHTGGLTPRELLGRLARMESLMHEVTAAVSLPNAQRPVEPMQRAPPGHALLMLRAAAVTQPHTQTHAVVAQARTSFRRCGC